MPDEKESFYKIECGKNRVKVTFHYMPKEDQERRFEAFLQDLSRVFDRKVNFTMMFDVTKIGASVPLSFVRSLAHWMAQMEEQIREWLDATAVLVTSVYIKIFLQAVFKIRKPKKPQKTFTDANAAFQWLKWKS